MRLTKAMRNEILNSIMDDVPQKDYATEYKNLIQKTAYEQLPDAVKRIHDDIALQVFLEKECIYYRHHSWGVCARNNQFDITPVKSKLDKIIDASQIQDKERRQMRTKIMGALNSVTTFKAAKLALPEFEKYFPEPEEPIDTNLISNLKKMGWKQK